MKKTILLLTDNIAAFNTDFYDVNISDLKIIRNITDIAGYDSTNCFLICKIYGKHTENHMRVTGRAYNKSISILKL